MSKVDNQREFSRVGVSVRVEIERHGLDTFKAIAEDVSLNGIRIVSDASFDVDIRCDVNVILGDENGAEGEQIIIQAHGCAVRSDGHFVAIHFDNLEMEGYTHLKKLIQFNALDSDQVEREFDEHIGLHRKGS